MFNYQRVMISLKCRAKFKNPNPENRRLRHDNGRLPCWLAPHISANGWILAAPKKIRSLARFKSFMAMNIIELDQFWDMLGMIPHMLPIMWAKFPSNKKSTWHTWGTSVRRSYALRLSRLRKTKREDAVSCNFHKQETLNKFKCGEYTS